MAKEVGWGYYHELFHGHADRVRACGYPETLLRLWHFYLSYCEGGFAERTLGNVQIVLQDNAVPTCPLRVV